MGGSAAVPSGTTASLFLANSGHSNRLIRATIVEGKATGEVCLDDGENSHQHLETAIGAGLGGGTSCSSLAPSELPWSAPIAILMVGIGGHPGDVG